jgi:ectoine hydroxylase-related dioxygenase (phytanoyl-CoA dioxygenase family)
MVERYQTDGFIHIPNVLTADEVSRYQEAAVDAAKKMSNYAAGTPLIFNQTVNVWTQNDIIRELTLNPRIAAIATRLAGVPLRLWHDHTLIKPPVKSAPTEFHQDGPYWPHNNKRNALSCWIALVDVPVERGCMTFIPGSHRRLDLRPQDLTNSQDLFNIYPELTWAPRVTVPLHAGDCTFHHSYVAHMANSNISDVPRVAHIIIYMDADTTFNGNSHVITDPLHLKVGDPLDGDLFPQA